MLVYEGNKFRGGFEKTELASYNKLNKKLEVSKSSLGIALGQLEIDKGTWIERLSKIPQFPLLNPMMLARAIYIIIATEEKKITPKSFRESLNTLIEKKGYISEKDHKEEEMTLLRYVRFLSKSIGSE
jgi:hypothetical protein